MPPANPTPTRLSVIIIGAGFAGLTAAIECHRHGHSVVILESFPALKPLGDIISFGHNAGRIFRRWPGVEDRLDTITMAKETKLDIKRYNGEFLYRQMWEEDEILDRIGGKKFNGHRAEIHKIVWDYAVELGVEIRTGTRVVGYWEEDGDGRKAGVVTEGGERVAGDVVVAADGVRSVARTVVLGKEDKPISSGYAVWRAWFKSDELMGNEFAKGLVENGDTWTAWLGPDVHFISASMKGGKEFNWVCTHKDEADIEESWSFPGDIAAVKTVLKGWEPTIHAIIDATPVSCLVDWKLVYRDPLPTWVSPKKRIVLIGDAAHPFLPTSIQGASQAMEDGASIAVCLSMGLKHGRGGVTEALPVFERIRYERVKRAQKMGETTRDKWHVAHSHDSAKDDPKELKLERPIWLLAHDAEAHAYEVYDEVVEELKAEASAPAAVGRG